MNVAMSLARAVSSGFSVVALIPPGVSTLVLGTWRIAKPENDTVEIAALLTNVTSWGGDMRPATVVIQLPALVAGSAPIARMPLPPFVTLAKIALNSGVYCVVKPWSSGSCPARMIGPACAARAPSSAVIATARELRCANAGRGARRCSDEGEP